LQERRRVPLTMTQTDTMTDIRSFFAPKTETETEAKPEPETTQPELEEAYRQGFKDAKEEVWAGWEFEPTLHDIASNTPTMRKMVDGEQFFRFPTTEEEDKVIWTGETFRFPIAYTWDGIKYVTYRAVLTGTTWTLREFLQRAQMVYSVQKRKHLKAMGDHIFFEGFIGDTFHCGS
jgi:hypothetical protein